MQPYTVFNPFANRGVQTIKRLTVKEAAALVSVTYKDLYNAYYQGRCGGYVQKDKENGQLYVLESEIHKLRELLAQRAAGPVVKVGFTDRRKGQWSEERRAKHQQMVAEAWAKRKTVKPTVDPSPQSLAALQKTLWRKEVTANQKPGGYTVVSPEEFANLTKKVPEPVSVKAIAIDLIQNGFTDAGVYLLKKDQ